LGEALGGQGQILITLAYSQFAPLELRRKGFENVLREKYPDIQVIDTVETTFDLEMGYACAQTILERYPNLAGVYVTDGIIPQCFARAATEAGADGFVKIIGHDLVDETMYYVQEGTILATLSQDLFAQGHDSVIHLFNYLTTGWRPHQPRVLTRLQVVTRDNYHQHWQPGRGCFESSGAMPKRLAQPIRRAARPLRIAVHNRDCSGVDQHLQVGMLAAAAKLRSYNARVELISGGTVTVEPIIDSVVAQGYDAISVLAANKKDTPCLNRAVDAGVAVATYNGEPLSLQAWVASLTDRTQELMGMSNGSAGPSRPSHLIHDTTGRGKPNGQRFKPQPEIIHKAICFMQENLEAAVGVADVARHVALDPSYFCRLFTEQTGRNPRDFLMDLRIERAKYYLENTGMSVMDVCVALGYSPSYFSRFFKRRMGCTPGQYAQRARCR
jgi:ABC-type sugar transport system substrate-binding protein/AraC-like DNA-binding protein